MLSTTKDEQKEKEGKGRIRRLKISILCGTRPQKRRRLYSRPDRVHTRRRGILADLVRGDGAYLLCVTTTRCFSTVYYWCSQKIRLNLSSSFDV
jgi:hypothetical protein